VPVAGRGEDHGALDWARAGVDADEQRPGGVSPGCYGRVAACARAAVAPRARPRNDDQDAVPVPRPGSCQTTHYSRLYPSRYLAGQFTAPAVLILETKTELMTTLNRLCFALPRVKCPVLLPLMANRPENAPPQ
jgi:hypothetical protein